MLIKEFQKEYRWLSNFASVEFTYEGIEYPSIEHAYVAAMSLNKEWRVKCSNKNLHPSQMKGMGKNVNKRSDWEEVKVDVMRKLIDLKFNEEPFKTKLLNTKHDYIQEGNDWSGVYWGVCLKTGEGLNVLGELIMEKRDNLVLNG